MAQWGSSDMERLSELPMVTAYQPNLYDFKSWFLPFWEGKKET